MAPHRSAGSGVSFVGVLPVPAVPVEADGCEDTAVRGRAAECLPGQEPARAAARTEPADPPGSIFRHFGVQSPK